MSGRGLDEIQVVGVGRVDLEVQEYTDFVEDYVEDDELVGDSFDFRKDFVDSMYEYLDSDQDADVLDYAASVGFKEEDVCVDAITRAAYQGFRSYRDEKM